MKKKTGLRGKLAECSHVINRYSELNYLFKGVPREVFWRAGNTNHPPETIGFQIFSGKIISCDAKDVRPARRNELKRVGIFSESIMSKVRRIYKSIQEKQRRDWKEFNNYWKLTQPKENYRTRNLRESGICIGDFIINKNDPPFDVLARYQFNGLPQRVINIRKGPRKGGGIILYTGPYVYYFLADMRKATDEEISRVKA